MRKRNGFEESFVEWLRRMWGKFFIVEMVRLYILWRRGGGILSGFKFEYDESRGVVLRKRQPGVGSIVHGCWNDGSVQLHLDYDCFWFKPRGGA